MFISLEAFYVIELILASIGNDRIYVLLPSENMGHIPRMIRIQIHRI